MKPVVAALVTASVCLGAAVAQEPMPPRAGTPELMRALASGGYVIYFRHGHTQWQQKVIEQAMTAEGRHDLTQCATQRNLDDTGRADARRIAAALQAARIPVGQVLASLYCRPAEYVALIAGRAPERVRWLTGLSTPESLREIKRAVATAPAAGTNTLLGGHGDRPFDLTGLVIQEGDALVFDPRNHRADDPAKFTPVAWITPAQWLASSGAAPPRAHDAPTLARIVWPSSAHHDAANLRRSLPALVEGAALDAAAHRRALQLLRENPSKNVETTFASSAAGDDAVDVQVAIADTRPWSIGAGIAHASAHDGGGRGRDRVWLSASHANLFNRDHHATLHIARAARGQGTTTSVAYRAPLPHRGTMLGLVATRAHEGAGLDADERAIAGSGRHLTLYARQHLAPRADYHHRLQLALADHRWSGDDERDTRSRPFALGYAAQWEQEWIGWQFNVEGVADATRRSGQRWQALRAQAQWLRVLTYDIRLRLAGRMQWSDKRLLPGEQFALGGALQPWGSSFGLWPRGPWLHRDGLRGVPERAGLGSSGAVASAELWSRRLFAQDLRVGGFVDLGTAQRRATTAGSAGDAHAASLGLNAHWQLRGQLALAASAAHVVRGGGVVRNGANRIDLTLSARY